MEQRMGKFYMKAGVLYMPGIPWPLGASLGEDGSINFSINSLHAGSCTLVLYHKGAKESYAEIAIPEAFKHGSNYAIKVLNLDATDVEYGYRFGGRYSARNGLRFNKHHVLLDPYATQVTGHDTWGKLDYADSNFLFRGCVSKDSYDWAGDRPLERPLEETIIYEMHVRGFSQHATSGVEHPGTYAGLMEKIPYLKSLGITCVELLPVYDFNEREFDRQPEKGGIPNFWGYSPLNFFTPKAGYASCGNQANMEFKDLVKALHKAGLEVILDVVYNHTGEFAVNKQSEPYIFSMRGVDNPTYYLLQSNGEDSNYTGCSNTLNCAHPVVRKLILDSLRYWVTEYHVDGFRFDLASVLSRGMDGQPQAHPAILEAITLDPVLAKTKLIAEAWDAVGLYQVGNFPAPKRWSTWNDRFRNTLRGYLKGDALAGKDLIKRIEGSPDVYEGQRATASINFVTCHDGFTLMDLFSYEKKHNEINRENNKDGTDWNVSQNCGVEGPTKDTKVMTLRKQCIKNAQVITLISRGVPMLLAGDEFGNSQRGNNNAYCQDNPISWLEWDNIAEYGDILALVKKMTALRKKHPVLRFQKRSKLPQEDGYQDISFHGTRVNDIHLDQPMLTFAVLFAERAKLYPVKEDTYIYVGMNQYSRTQKMELPTLPAGFVWRKYLETTSTTYDDHGVVNGYYELPTRAVVVLLAKKEPLVIPKELTVVKSQAVVPVVKQALTSVKEQPLVKQQPKAMTKVETDTAVQARAVVKPPLAQQAQKIVNKQAVEEQ